MKKIYLLMVLLFLGLGLQAQVEKTIENTAGNLKTLLSAIELATVNHLTITGTMDARDFKTIHDEMPLLVILDIKVVTIEAFTLFEHGGIVLYPANTIPQAHPWNEDLYTEYALAGHQNLTIIKLPVSLTAIGYMAFNNCTSLTSIEISSLVSNIEHYTFFNCTALESVILPSTITHIGVEAFFGCIGLKSIYCHAINPPEIDIYNSVYEVFGGVNITNCILHVPFGTKELYENAGEWGNFPNIIEMYGLFVSANHAILQAEQSSTSTIRITSDVAWQITSNQPWLSVSPCYGKGVHTLTFTANANTADSDRQATVTVSAPEFDPQAITIIQRSLTTGMAEMAQNRPSINYYPNPFVDNIMIEIQNPKHEQLTVAIYNICGQSVKNLTIKNKDEIINFTWDGTNEQGKKVPYGMYLLKVNEQAKKVVFGK